MESYFKENAQGYTCKLQRSDDPSFVEYFQTHEEMWDRIDEIEAETFPPHLKLVR